MDNVIKKQASSEKVKNNKFTVLLEDFHINICNVTNEMDKNKIGFYFSNIEDIERIAKIRDQIKNGIKESIKRVAEPLKLKSDEKKHAYCVYYKTKDKQLMYKIIYNDLFTETKSLKVIIEINGNLISKFKDKEQRNNIKFKEDEDKLIKDTMNLHKEGKGWIHVVEKKYTLLSDDEIINISDFIYDKIKNDPCLSSIFNKICDFKNQ